MKKSAREVLRELLAESDALLDLAAKVQVENDTEGDAAARSLESLYRDWYARACNALPEKYQQKFRYEYDGDWVHDRIKKFLKHPRERRVDLPGMTEDLRALLATKGPWQNPWKDVFSGPFLEQRQLLHEALGDAPSSPTTDALDQLEAMFRRLHLATAILSRPRRDRAPFTIIDEYDVQTLVHALLRLFYADVRDEEQAPSKAGAASRVDFLLKQEKVVVETKHTRAGLGAAKLGDELAADLLRYKAHPDADALFVLVYDPEHRVNNPAGFENDLRADAGGLLVRVVVVPH
jgi:hypothetical protein